MSEQGEAMQIVLAWAREESEWDGQPFAQDLGGRPTMKAVQKPYAAMWLNDGTDKDLEAAESYARSQGCKVFTFHGETDPLEAARRQVSAQSEHLG